MRGTNLCAELRQRRRRRTSGARRRCAPLQLRARRTMTASNAALSPDAQAQQANGESNDKLASACPLAGELRSRRAMLRRRRRRHAAHTAQAQCEKSPAARTKEANSAQLTRQLHDAQVTSTRGLQANQVVAHCRRVARVSTCVKLTLNCSSSSSCTKSCTARLARDK